MPKPIAMSCHIWDLVCWEIVARTVNLQSMWVKCGQCQDISVKLWMRFCAAHHYFSPADSCNVLDSTNKLCQAQLNIYIYTELRTTTATYSNFIHLSFTRWVTGNMANCPINLCLSISLLHFLTVPSSFTPIFTASACLSPFCLTHLTTCLWASSPGQGSSVNRMMNRITK